MNWRNNYLTKILAITTIVMGIGLLIIRIDSTSDDSEYARQYAKHASCPGECHGSKEFRDDGYAGSSTDGWDGDSRGGYASSVSVLQGGSIDFHISTNLSTYDLKIYREGATRQLMTTISGLTGPGTAYSCEEGYNPPGCGWPVAHTLNVPASWPSGAYTVEIPTTSDNRYIVFWVREDDPGSTANILFLAAANTY
ncbi:MAG: hypothetical protein GY869_14045, partial [Planctomycetes bacterium]|nr:hypothetical protein [Planctomycetota bacterium]